MNGKEEWRSRPNDETSEQVGPQSDVLDNLVAMLFDVILITEGAF
jgi:hypothetical protein